MAQVNFSNFDLGGYNNTEAALYNYNVFPSNLSNDQMSHFMKLTAYTGSLAGTGSVGGVVGAPTNAEYSAFLFLPSGAGSGGAGITYIDSHEFADLKLGNIIEKGALGTAGAAAAGTFRRATNPGVQVIYRNTKLREFNFAFLLTPSSESESYGIKNIVKNIRRYAAPKLTMMNLMYEAPAEWDVSFYMSNNGSYIENEAIPKLRRCVLSDISVDYTSQGEWSTFSNGYPVACMLILKFQELEIIHREFVERGY